MTTAPLAATLSPEMLAGVVALLLTLMFGVAMSVVAERYRRTPSRDDALRDPPPTAWRRVWFLVRALAPLAAVLITPRQHRALTVRLREAGLEMAVTPEEFTAARVLAAGAAATVGWAVLSFAQYASPTVLALIALLGWQLPASGLRDTVSRRRRRLVRDLPMVLELVSLAVKSGMTTSVALSLAAERGPPGPLREELARVLREIKAGRTRQEALRALAERYPLNGLRHAIAAILTAERQGADLSTVLRAQAAQRRQERFLAAERLAMQAPVKLLLPLVGCIFPGTFIVLLFPVAVQLLESGLL